MTHMCGFKLTICSVVAYGFFGCMSQDRTCFGQQRPTNPNSETNVLFQRKLQPILKHGNLGNASSDVPPAKELPPAPALLATTRSQALDAQFLIQATFGPTRTSLKQLKSMTYEDWIKKQMELPASSHREHYRTSVNPIFDDNVLIKSGRYTEVKPCHKGSRWVGHVFKKKHVGKIVDVHDGRIDITKELISHIDPSLPIKKKCFDSPSPYLYNKDEKCEWLKSGSRIVRCRLWALQKKKYCQQTCWDVGRPYKGDDCSGGWASYESKHMVKYVCEVAEHVGGLVVFSKDKECKDGKFTMSNPAIWFSDSRYYIETTLAFESSPSLRDKIFLAEGSDQCSLSADKSVKYNGKYYTFEPRTALMTNTLDSPDTSNPSYCVPRNFQNENSCVIAPDGSKGCPLSCGSIGEFGSVPTKGHQFSMVTHYIRADKKQDFLTDTRMDNTVESRERGKEVVWTMKALQSDDQLRQRIAWALSQILVVAIPGLAGLSKESESLTNYYDIFVRNAFGNFRNILSEVTYSPVMGYYLTYEGSKSYDKSRAYPDENYAREIMQLFTVGTNLLHPDGSVVKDEAGIELPAYNNQNIMDFARVFTGLDDAVWRGNIEQAYKNRLDPMIMEPENHDTYPKPGLDGNYIGDSYPLCSDIPQFAFLAKGAKYQFLGHKLTADAYENVFELEEGSELRRVLSDFKITISLKEKINCFGAECSFRTLTVVKVGTGLYEYIAPTCVDLFFSEGQTIGTTHWSREVGVSKNMKIVCAKGHKIVIEEAYISSECGMRQEATAYTNRVAEVCNGDEKCTVGWTDLALTDPCPGKPKILHVANSCIDKETNQAKVSKSCQNPAFAIAGAACSKGCTDEIPGSWAKKGISCDNHCETKTVKVNIDGEKVQAPFMFRLTCNKNQNWRENHFCAFTCANNPNDCIAWDENVPYQDLDCSTRYQEDKQCGSIKEQMNFKAAEAHCKSLGMHMEGNPKNQCPTNMMNHWTGEPCDMTLQVHSDGMVSGQTKWHEENRFAVQWDGGMAAPANEDGSAKEYAVRVEVRKVFDAVPSKAELVSKLKIGAFTPSGPGVVNGDITVFDGGNGIDENTIFECDGFLYKNVESIVHVEGFSFRNPPVFLRPGIKAADTTDTAMRRKAFWEVEALLDHLFHHPNTPVNIGWKLIQRFTSSNPSAAYLTAVAKAFETGTYEGMTFSGKRGDLAATMSAVLLHEEARAEGEIKGALREPLLKLMHLMRSMEYEDWYGEPIILKNLQDELGQFPYWSPSVFNFYYADYAPPYVANKIKAHPDFETGHAAYAPEFQIFTPPFVINFIIAAESLIEYGVTECKDGKGEDDDFKEECERGALKYSPEETSDVVQEINILLTGGRLVPHNVKIVTEAYNSVPGDFVTERSKIKAAQMATVFSPEFNTMGSTQELASVPTVTKAPHEKTHDYKAVVLAFLLGGADTYQMVVPRECSLHDSYAKVREGMNIKIGDLLPIVTPSQKCQQFGINNALLKIHELFQQKKAGFVSNIGNIVQPIDARNLTKGAIPECPHQYSHSHAQHTAQTMQCGSSDDSPIGTGGYMAEELSKQGMNAATFSISGVSTWAQAKSIKMEILHKKYGSLRFNDYDIWHDVIDNITSEKHSNVFCDGYAEAFGQAMVSSETMADHLDSIRSASLEEYSEKAKDSVLSQQLHQVARLIHTREQRKAERDFFFVQMGGWDTHSGINDKLPDLFKKVDTAIADFVSELEAQNVFEKVVLITLSDFGRTLSFNGHGTDHGWGANHIIVGGDVRGGQIFNEFLETYELGSAYDAGRGRIIPKYPWESMLVPIAEWMGVANLDPLFPNLKNFDRSKHIINKNDLFGSSKS